METREFTRDDLLYSEDPVEGWGRFHRTHSRVYHLRETEEIRQLVTGQQERKLLAHGMGRSYGDAALNSDQDLLDCTSYRYIQRFNPHDGTLICEAGVTVKAIAAFIVKYGWFLPVTPGTREVTVGGCIACDVHGKNHQVAGSFSNHLDWIELMTADGCITRCSRDENSDLFHATAGGLGLTGIILRAQIRLKSIPSAYLESNTTITHHLQQTMEAIAQNDSKYPYSVAWIDGTADKEMIGRGVVFSGRFAETDQLPKSKRKNPFSFERKREVDISFSTPVSLVNRLTQNVFNRLYSLKEAVNARKKLEHYKDYFYPLDSIGHWNRLYGRKGLVQYQCVIPDESAEDVINSIFSACRDYSRPPSLAVLKRFGEGNPYLSFPRPGWTLALDFPASRSIRRVTRSIDQLLVDVGGRVYLGKDALLDAATFRLMYPEFEDWLKVKNTVDPAWLFQSDLARRLKLS